MTEAIVQSISPIRMGDKAPDFRARTTMGEKSLADFRGQWLIFFSHPADFTPVCTTEFLALARAVDRFEAAGCALLGLSVDSLYSHLAWVRAIEDQHGIKIPFPIVEDPSMAVGRAYGMIDETAVDSTAIRSSYFIDPEGVVRASTCYPHNVGRSVAEMLRLLCALQAVSDGKGLTPEGWQNGDPLLALPAATLSEMLPGQGWFCQKVETK
ncbi:peroxiredoxin [Sphingopyxis sp.]|uniref:peroxiredoxin n=1 Tax=Sphingopyxis sp. TaxID=1908224 RepID=UPI001DC26492|nr:peroxiredoxin [Sphingopyxis sp.]MBW8294461.1 peroxiredoxin [Sphingopyxis sp.]